MRKGIDKTISCKIIIFVTKLQEKKPQRLILFQVVLQTLKLNQQPHGKLTFLDCDRWPEIRQDGCQRLKGNQESFI